MSVTLRRPVPGYRPDIDGLRAVAVISVVIFHAFPGALAGGFAGVDIFFAISGYLISQHIIETLDQGRFSLVDFYVRRIKRIYPALVTVMVVTLVAGIAVMASGELRQLAADALASVAFVANIYFYLTRDYFSQGASASPLLHLWSLGVEEQYYIIWPVALFVLWRFASRRVATFAIAAAILLSFACSIVLSRTHAIAAFYLPLTRFWELLFGSALAWAQFHTAKRSAVPASDTVSAARLPLRDLASVVGGALIAASFALFDPATVFPGWRAAFPAGGATLIIAAGPAAWFNRRVLSVKPLTYIGLVSYPFYLWHWPILVFLRLLSSGTPTAAMLIAAIVVAFALSSITFSFIERPARYSRVVRWHPLRPRRDDDGHRPVQLRDFARQRLARPFSRCELRCESGALGIHRCVQQAFPASELCVMPAPDGRPEVALLGDSHANHFYDGLQPALASEGASLFAVGAGNCPPFSDVDIYLDKQVKHCSELFRGALDYVVNSPEIHSVILSSYAISTIAGGLDYGEGDTIRLLTADSGRAGLTTVGESDGSNLSVYLAGLEHTLSRLTAAGKRVVFVLDTPELDFDPSTCVRRPVQFSVRSPCAVPRAKVEHRLTGAETRILAVLARYPDVKVFNPLPFLCDAQNCYARRGGEFMYADRDHLTPDGSRYIGKWLARDIEDAGGT